MRCFMGLFLLGVIECAVTPACAPRYAITVVGERGISAEAELDVQEVVIRNLLTREPPGKPIFVSFGKSWKDHVDPPEGFLERLSDVDAVLMPVSEYGRHAGTNPLLLIVRVTNWVGEADATVSATRFRLGVGGAGGFTAKVKWSRGTWRMVRAVESWTS